MAGELPQKAQHLNLANIYWQEQSSPGIIRLISLKDMQRIKKQPQLKLLLNK